MVALFTFFLVISWDLRLVSNLSLQMAVKLLWHWTMHICAPSPFLGLLVVFWMFFFWGIFSPVFSATFWIFSHNLNFFTFWSCNFHQWFGVSKIFSGWELWNYSFRIQLIRKAYPIQSNKREESGPVNSIIAKTLGFSNKEGNVKPLREYAPGKL